MSVYCPHEASRSGSITWRPGLTIITHCLAQPNGSTGSNAALPLVFGSLWRPKRKKGFPWFGPSSWYRRPGGLGCIYTRVCVCVCVRVIDTVKKEKPRSFRFKGSFLDSCLRRFFRPPWPLKALIAAACCHRSRSGPWKTKEMLRDGARRRERSHPPLSVKI